MYIQGRTVKEIQDSVITILFESKGPDNAGTMPKRLGLMHMPARQTDNHRNVLSLEQAEPQLPYC